ncbi:putative disease resistance protein RGA3 [Carica papaya]|uniref:putative disease resistance protein RGA3 n=1 Tax=Carica papaya TaxID=3649 RepID=UPI000B8CE46B|nr:putative disease resistance protein RGA3 [Carica papaya]
MADAIISAVLQQLVSIAYREVEQEVRLVVGVEEEVQKLTCNFKAIQDVLEDAEKRLVKEANVRNWLEELKDASYDMEDVLDEWNTALLKLRIEGEEKKVENGSVLKVCSSFSSSCCCINRSLLRHDIAHKIKKLNERLDAIANERIKYEFQSGRETAHLERQMTSSVIDEFQVRGREETKNRVVRMLLEESSQGSPFQTISIIGMGGLGKTTLAQLAFNDKGVKEHFEKRIWVCVSDPFDEIRIAKAILESVLGSTPNLVELENLLQAIQQYIKNKKFLLVMDDVWNEDSLKWACLEHSLKCGLQGSKILVTTRKESVANIMGSRSTHMYFLEKLSEEECWSVFSNIAFFGRTDEECKHLEDIGRKIARKCNGLPLAAKFLGGLLRFRKTREQWESVLDNQIWELKEAEQELFPHLLLSYYDLPSEVRQCFLYCAIFPKDYIISREKLIRLWMAQGYLKDNMEIVGQVYFDNLAMRSFFQDFENVRYDETKLICKMHDIVHDFAQFLVKNECFLIENSETEMPKIKSLCEKTRHSMILVGENSPFPVYVYKLKKLRSILVGFPRHESKSDGPLLDLFSQLTFLRSLDLGMPVDCSNSLSKLPKEVGQLIHLRLLDLSWNSRDEECEHLKEIGRKISRKFDGLPLAAKFLGGLLRFRKTRKQWQNVLDNQIWELKEAKEEVFRHFQLSYYDLPSEVRQCFLYCAIFPKDYIISKKKLIRLWMAQGYLEDNMEKGELYFNNLAMRSFFQDFRKHKTNLACKMHDVVHDFAKHLTKNEFFLVNSANNEACDNELYEKVRHSMILSRSDLPFPVSVYKLKKVRSLLLTELMRRNSETEKHLVDLCGQLTCLRSLDLSVHINCSNSLSKLPKGIEQLIHLRLLDLSSNTALRVLPESLCHLYNLQILNICCCLFLRGLPHGMEKLINLRHLYNLGTYKLTFIPKGLGRLTSLSTFECLVVGSNNNDGEAMTLGDLQQLNNLKGTLHIRGLGNVKDVLEATNAQLLNKKHLRDLQLRFDGLITDAERIDDLLLEALQPPSDLEILEITDYIGPTMCPNWLMQLPRLRKLTLGSFINIEQLPPLGILPGLQVLKIRNMPKVKKLGLEFLGIGTLPFSSSVAAFPQLQKLHFSNMKNWEEWDFEITTGTVHHSNSSTSSCIFMVMPRLSYLLIQNCDKLKELKQPYEDLRKDGLIRWHFKVW